MNAGDCVQVTLRNQLPAVASDLPNYNFMRLANKRDRLVIDSPQPRLGILTAGKSYLDVRQAMDELHAWLVAEQPKHLPKGPMGDAIKYALNSNAVVVVSPLGFSPTGEAFNLTMEDVSCSVATALKADKLVLLTETAGINDDRGELIGELAHDLRAIADIAGQALHRARLDAAERSRTYGTTLSGAW